MLKESRILLEKYPFLLRWSTNSEIKYVDKLDPCNVLVLAPHPDDDVLGCGGILAKHCFYGSHVTCLYMTDGGGGDPSGLLTREELVQERRKEAKAACDLIGVLDLNFLDHRDGELQLTESTVKELTEIISRINPQIVFLPFLLDGLFHRDHLETNKIFVGAIQRLKADFSCWAYEIYSPLIPNRLVDITEQMELKKKAIQMHKSQLRVRNYLEAVVALNSYRGYTFGELSTRYMEAFIEIEPARYLELFNYVFSNT